MKKSFITFCRKNIACANLAIQSQLEYRFNLITDAIIQPVITATIEAAMWYSLFGATGKTEIGGFSIQFYLAYMIWASFFSRISANWMYEFRMINEIESGSINSILTRPISFYEYYFSQFMGYKLLTSLLSMIIPISIFLIIDTPTDLSRFPLAFGLTLFYLIFVYTLSFCTASLSFFLSRTHALTVTKNFAIWILSGELFPLDLVPDPFKNILIHLPFSSAVYIPVGYLTHRFNSDLVISSFQSVSFGIILTGFIAILMWKTGRSHYVGTGA